MKYYSLITLKVELNNVAFMFVRTYMVKADKLTTAEPKVYNRAITHLKELYPSYKRAEVIKFKFVDKKIFDLLNSSIGQMERSKND